MESDEMLEDTLLIWTTNHDFHATLFHLLGLNHEKFTMRHDGLARRLTDVHGQVGNEILA